MVHFVGAGSGAADLITVRGSRLLGEADVDSACGISGQSGVCCSIKKKAVRYTTAQR